MDSDKTVGLVRITHTNESSPTNKNHANKSRKYIITALIFLGLFNMLSLRENLNIAIVEMSSNKTVQANNETIIRQPDFSWDSRIKGLILSAFFYGFLLSPLGGYFDNKFGGSTCYGAGMLISSILTILSPYILQFSLYWFIFCRVLTGVTQGISNSCEASVWHAWTSTEDRSKLMTFAMSGASIAICVVYPVCGYFGYHYGWKTIFYVTGGFSLIWCFIWNWFAGTKLRKPLHKQNRSNISQTKDSIPWMKILKCKQTWAISMVKFYIGWEIAFTNQCLPLYLKDSTQAEVYTIGYLSSTPNISGVIGLLTTGLTINFVVKRKILTNSQIHKIIICLSLTISSLMMISMTYQTDYKIALMCTAILKLCSSSVNITAPLVALSMALQFGSVICGIYATCYTVSRISAPTFIGFTVVNHTTSEWNKYFFLGAFLAFTANIVYLRYGSSECQPWTEIHKTEEINKLKEDNN